MIRCFLAISLPDDVSDALVDLQDKVRNARWIEEESFHITLNFLGDCDRHQLNDLDAALAALSVERFELSVAGTGAFGGGTPHLLYAGLEENTPLRRLQTKTALAAREAGIAIESRKYVPHVTLARCSGGVIPVQALEWVRRHNLHRSEPFLVSAFGLYRSDLGNGPPVYTELVSYPLTAPKDPHPTHGQG